MSYVTVTLGEDWWGDVISVVLPLKLTCQSAFVGKQARRNRLLEVGNRVRDDVAI